MSSRIDEYWTLECGNSNYGTYKEDRLLTLPVVNNKYIIERRRGRTLWTWHKCIKCGASREKEIIWLRMWNGYCDPMSHYVEEGTHVRLHEECVACGRATSWPYHGEAEGDFKPDELLFASNKDVQKGKVYTWERALVSSSHFKEEMQWERMLDLVCDLFHQWNLPMPKVRRGKGKTSWMRGTNQMSIVPEWGCTPHTVIHETAHGITNSLEWHKIIPAEANHGPGFVAVFILLLQIYDGGRTHEDFGAILYEKAQQEYGIVVTPPTEIAQALLKLKEKRIAQGLKKYKPRRPIPE